MTTVSFLVEQSRIVGFDVQGHSGWGDEGADIVCAAVTSAIRLVESTVNDVMGLCASVKIGEKDAKISFRLPGGLSAPAESSGYRTSCCGSRRMRSIISRMCSGPILTNLNSTRQSRHIRSANAGLEAANETKTSRCRRRRAACRRLHRAKFIFLQIFARPRGVERLRRVVDRRKLEKRLRELRHPAFRLLRVVFLRQRRAG